ncbi:hypothetical protein EDB84DRAFT_1445533, partial [Lactarius hengduanensis]
RQEGVSETALGPVNVPDTSRVVDFVCGSEQSCACSSPRGRGGVGRGWNEHGNLATGSLSDVKAPSGSGLHRPRKPEKTGEVVGVWAGVWGDELDFGSPASLHG